MLGMMSHPHHAQFVPKFCKSYAQLGHIIQDGLTSYKRDVETGAFPGTEFSPYVMKEEEKKSFDELLAKDANERQVHLKRAAEDLTKQDEYEKLHLYGPVKGNEGSN